MAVIKRLSLVDQVYEKLREKIVHIKVPFGSKLNVSKLQDEYGVSSTPVREALNRLLNEGLIEFENNVGATVLEITEKDVNEIQELAAAYEMAAARYAMKKGKLEDIAKEIAAHIEEYKLATDRAESCKCIRKIKDAFYRNAGNSRLISKSSSLNGLEEILHTLFAMPSVDADAEKEFHSGMKYFDEIHKAVLVGDFAGVCDGLEAHRAWAKSIIVKNLKAIEER